MGIEDYKQHCKKKSKCADPKWVIFTINRNVADVREPAILHWCLLVLRLES